MKNIEGLNFVHIFLNVVNFDFNPAEFTPNNLNDFEKFLVLLRLPLLIIFFFVDNTFIDLFTAFVDLVSFLVLILEDPGCLKPSEKPADFGVHSSHHSL